MFTIPRPINIHMRSIPLHDTKQFFIKRSSCFLVNMRFVDTCLTFLIIILFLLKVLLLFVTMGHAERLEAAERGLCWLRKNTVR